MIKYTDENKINTPHGQNAKEGALTMEDRLYGIKFWAVQTKTGLQVFKFIGTFGNLNYFKTFRGNIATIGLTSEQMDKFGIKPFCLNSEYLQPLKKVG